MIPLLNDIETQNRQANEYHLNPPRYHRSWPNDVLSPFGARKKNSTQSEQTNGKRNWKFNLDVGGAAAAEVMLRWEFAESLVCLCHRI